MNRRLDIFPRGDEQRSVMTAPLVAQGAVLSPNGRRFLWPPRLLCGDVVMYVHGSK